MFSNLSLPQPAYPFTDGQLNFGNRASSNGLGAQSRESGNDSLSSAAAAMAAAVVRQQMHQMASAGFHPDMANFNLPAHCSSSSAGNNGGSAGCIPMPKLGSSAASGQLSNNGGSGIPMPRLASPAIAGMPSSMHGLSGLSSLHMMQSMNSHLAASNTQSSQSSGKSGLTITPAHGSGGSSHRSNSNTTSTTSSLSQSYANAMAQLSSSSATAAFNMNRISSPAGSIHDLRMTTPENGPTHSTLEALENAGMNLAYKASRGYTASPRSDLFQDELNDFAQRAARYKEAASGNIKLEPITDCRGDWSNPTVAAVDPFEDKFLHSETSSGPWLTGWKHWTFCTSIGIGQSWIHSVHSMVAS